MLAPAPTEPVAFARGVLEGYDLAVKCWKRDRGHNVTLELDDPVPEVLRAWQGVPLGTAAAKLREALSRNPDDPAAGPLLAALEGRQGRAREAAAALETHVARHPRDAAGWNALGVACARLGGAGAAARKLDCYRRATELAPTDATAWANLGNALAAAGRPAEAIRPGLNATRLRRNYVYAWMNLGRAYGLLGERGREKEAYRRAIEVPPESEQCPFARFNLALCHEEEKSYGEAVRWYRDALAVGLPQGPKSRAAALFHHNLARALYHAGEYAAAAREANAALAIAPTLPEPYSLLGHLYALAGQAEPSRKAFRKATKLLAVHGPSAPDAPLRHAE